mmetsp:Transcript_93720/g.264553  ORF Transcript_93720/g.264553 Transcript_93720/m.264553 type:complete len:353 (+) Transcript_93720:121-1179(+)
MSWTWPTCGVWRMLMLTISITWSKQIQRSCATRCAGRRRHLTGSSRPQPQAVAIWIPGFEVPSARRGAHPHAAVQEVLPCLLERRDAKDQALPSRLPMFRHAVFGSGAIKRAILNLQLQRGYQQLVSPLPVANSRRLWVGRRLVCETEEIQREAHAFHRVRAQQSHAQRVAVERKAPADVGDPQRHLAHLRTFAGEGQRRLDLGRHEVRLESVLQQLDAKSLRISQVRQETHVEKLGAEPHINALGLQVFHSSIDVGKADADLPIARCWRASWPIARDNLQRNRGLAVETDGAEARDVAAHTHAEGVAIERKQLRNAFARHAQAIHSHGQEGSHGKATWKAQGESCLQLVLP